MKRRNRKNFIIYLFLIVTMFSVAGAGLEGAHLIDVHQSKADVMHCFAESEMLPEDNVTNIRVMKTGRALFSAASIRGAGSLYFYRTVLCSLLALVALSGLFLHAVWERFVLYCNRYTTGIGYQIVYIQAQDGRKRIS